MINLKQPMAHVEVKFYFEGNVYEVEDFRIGFAQSVDHKGQPQHEVRGGQLVISLSQMVDDGIYEWAKDPFLKKSGAISFETGISNSVLSVEFSQAYCVELTQLLDAFSGLVTNLIISPAIVTVNGIEHDNFWKN